MPNLLSILRRGVSERMDQNDWISQMFNYAGNAYPVTRIPYQVSDSYEQLATDFESYVADAMQANGVVFACMVARMNVFSEARFQWQKMVKGRPGDLFGHPNLSLLETPWPDGTSSDLTTRAILQADLSGNQYVVSEGVGDAKRLRCLRPDWVQIILTAPADKAVQSDVAGILFRPGGTMDPDLWETYPIGGGNGQVAHWAPIPDPLAQYRGMSWLTPIVREISTDKKIIKHKEKFFDNGTQPGLAISLKETVSRDQFTEFVEAMHDSKRGVDHAYENLYLGGGADVTVIGSKLDQVDFKTVGGHGETRICMAARIHPSIVGIAEALHGTTLNAGNYQSAKDQFVDMTMRPLWRGLCNSYATLVPKMKGARLWYDDRDIAFLRADRKNIAEVQQVQAATIGSYVSQGFTPDSAKLAVKENDITLLEHTGLYSVQLTPPGMEGVDEGTDANTPGQPGTGANKPDKQDGKKPAPAPTSKE